MPWVGIRLSWVGVGSSGIGFGLPRVGFGLPGIGVEWLSRVGVGWLPGIGVGLLGLLFLRDSCPPHSVSSFPAFAIQMVLMPSHSEPPAVAFSLSYSLQSSVPARTILPIVLCPCRSRRQDRARLAFKQTIGESVTPSVFAPLRLFRLSLR